MSDYVRVYNLTLKDSLPTGNSGKVIKGTELDVELNAVAAAISSKADSNDPTFTGTPLAPTATYGTNTTQLATTAFVQAALQAMYPVGSVYINATVATNPATLLGFGTWVTVGDGKVLINQDSGDTALDVLGETGGSKDAIVVSHTHGLTAASAASNGAHTHSITDNGHNHLPLSPSGGTLQNINPNVGVTPYLTAAYGDTGNGSFVTSTSTTGISINSGGAHTHSLSGNTDSSGSSATNANLPPYVVVRMWKRTA